MAAQSAGNGHAGDGAPTGGQPVGAGASVADAETSAAAASAGSVAATTLPPLAIHIDWSRVLIVELALLAACALLVVAWRVLAPFTHTIVLLLLALVVAFAVGPLVASVESRTTHRVLAVAIVYVGLLAAILGGLALVAEPLIGQVSDLLAALPQQAEQLTEMLVGFEQRLAAAGVPIDVGSVASQTSTALGVGGTVVLSGTLAVLTRLTSFVIDAVLVLIMSLYLVLDAERIRAALVSLVPAAARPHARFVEGTIARILGGYIRGSITMAASIGALAWFGAMLFGLPYPLVVGAAAGLFELIPMFGPVLGAVPAVLMALSISFSTAIWVALYFVAIQQIESNVLGPRILGHAVGLHPLGALVALLAGFEAAGVLGALFAVPIAGVLWVVGSAVYQQVHHGGAETRPPRHGWRIPFWRRRAAPLPQAATAATAAEHDARMDKVA